MRPVGLAAIALLLEACAGCRPDPEPPDSDSDSRDTEETETDSGPPPPCDVPEIEPNDESEASTPIPFETQGCGAIGRPLDLDHWSFAVERPMWLGVTALSTSFGSAADVAVVLTREGADATEARDRDGLEQDVELVVPVEPGSFTAMILDEGLQGGEDRVYELLVTEAKEPVAWTVEEAASHGTAEAAQALAPNDVVFARFQAASESDWYRVALPAGTTGVEVDVDAAAFGAPSDVSLYVHDADGARLFSVLSDDETGGRDPFALLPTDGDTVWTLRLSEAGGRGGSGWWYALRVTLKGGE
jgi:hypothetical protein